MTPDEIRKLNEDCQGNALKSESVPGHEAALKSLECSLLAEIAAQLAELNWALGVLRERPFPVQVEPGQYPIRVE